MAVFAYYSVKTGLLGVILLKKIKVVFMVQQLVCGGAEQALYDLISLLDKTKFDVSVLALVGGGVWEDKFRAAGIPVTNIFYRRPQSGSPMVFMKHQLRKMRIHSVMWKDSRKLLKMFVPQETDIVVAYSMWGDENAALAYDTKHVRFIHGNVANNPDFRKIIEDNLKFMREYQRIICVSQESYHAFRQFTGLKDTVRMYYNPLNSETVRQLARQTVELPSDVPVICAVGRLAPEKGYDRLIRIHKDILQQGTAHRLVLVGDGPEKEKLMRTVRETGTEESVIFAGYQSNPYPYMKNSRFLVSSSFTEGLPVIAMEALSLGIPIVSAVPSIGEIFGNECCGIITENDNESLKEGIRKMLLDEAFYAEARQGACSRSTFFDGRRMVKEIEDMFTELMEG